MTNIARHAASSHASFSVTMHIMRNTAEEGRFYQMSGKKTPLLSKYHQHISSAAYEESWATHQSPCDTEQLSNTTREGVLLDWISSRV